MSTTLAPILPNQPEPPSASILGPLTGLAAEGAAKSAIAKLAESPLLSPLFSAQALLPCLPLPFPSDPGCPPSPKRRYRSTYRYPSPQVLLQEGKLETMTDFQISLHLIDFSPLRDELARIHRPSHKG